MRHQRPTSSGCAELHEADKLFSSVVDPTGFLCMIGAPKRPPFTTSEVYMTVSFIVCVPFAISPSLQDTAEDIALLLGRYPDIPPHGNVEQDERDKNGNSPDLLYNGKSYGLSADS